MERPFWLFDCGLLCGSLSLKVTIMSNMLDRIARAKVIMVSKMMMKLLIKGLATARRAPLSVRQFIRACPLLLSW